VSNPPVTPTLPATDGRPREQYQDADSQATRHLSAGAYVDSSFRDLAIRKVKNNSQRRVAPSYGFDLVPVVRHVRPSRYLDPGLQVATIGSLVLGSRLAVALVVGVVLVCLMLHVAAQIIAATFRAQVAAVAEDWLERCEFRIRPETPGLLFLTTQARRILASASSSCLRDFLGSDQRGNPISAV
jgi:hypothetical protein